MTDKPDHYNQNRKEAILKVINDNQDEIKNFFKDRKWDGYDFKLAKWFTNDYDRGYFFG